MAKLQQLVALLVRFEKLLESDAPLAEVLPSIYKQHEERFTGYTLSVVSGNARFVCPPQRETTAKRDVP